jgi:hypothetical protein
VLLAVQAAAQPLVDLAALELALPVALRLAAALRARTWFLPSTNRKSWA